MPNEWLTKKEAAAILGTTERTVDRWASRGHIRTQDRMGHRGKLYSYVDAAALAAELADPSRQQETVTELVPSSELFTALLDTQEKLNRAMLEVGRLQGQLETQQQLLTDAETNRQRLQETQAELEQLKAKINKLPWLVRIVLLRG